MAGFPSGGGGVSGVTVTGTAAAGAVIVATSATAASWTTTGAPLLGLTTVATASGQSLLVKRGASTSFSVSDFSVTTSNNTLDSGNGSSTFNGPMRVQSAGLGIGVAGSTTGGTVATAPPTSATIQTALGNLVLGTAFQNTLTYDVILTVNLSVTVNTSGVIALGVGPTNTPAQTNIVSGVTTIGFVPVKFKVPAGYFALLSISGTITDSIAGQYLEAA